MPEPELKRLMNTIAAGTTLSADEITSALDLLMSDAATPVQMGAFLMGLRTRGETVEEITGAAQVMRQRMTRVTAPDRAVDIVGTGGDSHGTYNVSTCAALVAAGAGCPIAKHGNRSVSSLSGASDVLSELGVKLDIAPQTVSLAIAVASVGFMWAPMHHPMMKSWAPIRADLGVRTIFNLLGPLCNPAGVKRQVLGVFDKQWVEPLAHVMKNLGSEHVWVVCGSDGMDELTTTGPSVVAELNEGAISVFEVTPEMAGLKQATLGELKGGDAKVNAQAIRDLLDGKPGPFRDIVCLNAAAALVVGDLAAGIEDGVERAAHSIDEGRARSALEQLVSITNG